VNLITERQQELFIIDQYGAAPIGDWEWENSVPNQLGTKNMSVPNSPSSKLGTEISPVPNSISLEIPISNRKKLDSDPRIGNIEELVPNSAYDELGTGKTSLTRAEIWKPPVGLLVQTWIKNDWYWYWKYYDNRRKKRSIYLGKKYNKAVAKAQLIGIPADAKPHSIRASPPKPQTQTTGPT
jgi:hypothetical protein